MACPCCGGGCLCCSCVSRVVYTPSEPGADAQPFAGIAPDGGSWAWDEAGGYYYGEFPCHYVEYAFSEYAASIFPNAVNAGADAAYSGGGTWTKRALPGGETGETRCTGSTEEDCQPCLAYPGTAPAGDPLPTLEQLQQRCGIYHPCTPCENCSNAVDGCGVPGINQSQGLFGDGVDYGDGQQFPDGIPWPPPDGTCPCKLCDVLCLMRVGVTWQSKIRTVVIDGRHWPDCDYYSPTGYYAESPFTVPTLSELTLPANTVLIAGSTEIWGCNTADNRASRYPGEVYICQSLPCPDSGSEPPPEESEWWEEEYTFKGYYNVLRIVPDCCECQTYETDADCSVYADALACGGINQIEAHGVGLTDGGYEAAQFLKYEGCDFPFVCGIPCWDAPPCNPFP